MGEIVSLKAHRKKRDRVAKETRASENRASYGRTRSERKLADAARIKEEKTLDGHKREE